ncbi:transglutaminase family protein [Lignipirellula cremea]|uniref:Protein SirB1 N-terminal domain-containing protein n=1 Tax=Lignipirellula cremea TaxID=2528010 RepID=A0A518DKY2_9BACT|nr:transglutaminase-like domain-containing protein [Lignipirellula cremea]QDU92495.1 hypothetical protein Pla8534_02430 [Lignipirellula cremea]
MLIRVLKFRSLGAVLLLLLLGSPAWAESPAERVQRLIRELDHDEYIHRETAMAQLMSLGEAAMAPLLAALKHDSPEVRSRARAIVQVRLRADMIARFKELGSPERDADIDLEKGMWLIARIIDLEVEEQDLDKQLDALAAKVRAQFPPDADLRQVKAADAVSALRKVLFEDAKFSGSVADYDNPVNSSLSHVLKTREGLPILLSHLVVAVAQRADIPIVGVGIPGRYMCKYDLSQAPDKPTEELVLDPFGGGRLMTVAMLQNEIPGFQPTVHLQPSPHRDTLLRMLANLASDYLAVGKHNMANRVYEYQALLAASASSDLP